MVWARIGKMAKLREITPVKKISINGIVTYKKEGLPIYVVGR